MLLSLLERGLALSSCLQLFSLWFFVYIYEALSPTPLELRIEVMDRSVVTI